MRIVMLHGYSDSNKGDLAIVVATVSELTRAFPGCEIVLQSVYSRDEPNFEYHHRFVKRLGIKVESLPIPSPYLDEHRHSVVRNIRAMLRLITYIVKEWSTRHFPIPGVFTAQRIALKNIREADVVVLKGGQYIYNDQRGVRGWLYIWRILHPVVIASQWHRPIIMLGQSIGPLIGPNARKMTRKALSRCQRLVVREELSLKLMGELGLSPLTIQAPDMAFLTVPRMPEQSKSLEVLLDQMGHRPFLGVTVVNWNFPGSEDAAVLRQAYEEAIKIVCLRAHHELGMGVVLLPQVTVKHHGESDIDVIERLAIGLRDAEVEVNVVTEDLWPDEFSFLYSKLKVLLGTRLHSCILAACGYCPVVAVRYQGYKTEGVMRSLGMQDYVHDISNLDALDLFNAVARALAERESISAHLNERVNIFRATLQQLIRNEISVAVQSKKS